MRSLLALSLFLLFLVSPAHPQTAVGSPTDVQTRPWSELARGLPRTAAAQVRARHEADIAAEIAATLREVRVDAGESVPAGAVLAQLDDRDARLALAQANAQRDAAAARLSLARVRAERGERLGAKQFISGDELKALRTEVEVAKADLSLADVGVQQARRSVAKTTLRAPYALVVRQRMAQAGQQVAPGQPLFAVVSSDAPEVVTAVDTSLLAGLRGATPVFEFGAQRLPLSVVRISPVLSTATRTHEVRLHFSAGTAPVGAEGRVAWTDTRALLPAEFLLRRDASLGVFVLDPGSSRVRFHVLAEAEEGRPAAVDLPPDTAIVTRGREQLKAGDVVRVQAADPPAAE